MSLNDKPQNPESESQPQNITPNRQPKIRQRGRLRSFRQTRLSNNALPHEARGLQKPKLHTYLFNLLYKFLYVFGVTLLRKNLVFRRKMRKLRHVIAVNLGARFRQIGVSIRRWLTGFWNKTKAPFLRIRRTYREVLPEIRTRRANGKFPLRAYSAIIESVFRLIFKIIATIFNIAAPIAAVIFLVYVINTRVNETLVLALTYNGETLGYVEDESQFNRAAQDVQNRLNVDGESAFQIMIPHYEMMTLGEFNDRKKSGEYPKDASKLESDELADTLIRASDSDIAEAYGLYIDGEFLGAATEKDAILNEFDKILDEGKTGKQDETVSFVKDVVLTKRTLFPLVSVVPAGDLIGKLNKYETMDEVYIVKEGDSPSLISDKTGVPLDILTELNPDIEDNLRAGQEILTQVARPFMPVQSTFTEFVEEEVPFETIKVENATYAKGYSNVYQTGVNGLKNVKYRVSAVNGLEGGRVEVSSEILKHPVDERITIGINNPTVIAQPAPATQIGSNVPAKPPTVAAQPATKSGFLRPVPAGVGYMSCGIGGYPGHTGLDIAVIGGTGTPILASADGVVVLAKNSNVGYGRHIMIDHGNGYQTLYAHNSALYVSVGDYVSKGQVIAAMGRTGRATGVHCHFEIRLNGRYLNPADFIGYR